MPKIVYVPKKFGVPAREIIRQANEIIGEYQRQGYDLTLRQLYYQFVSRDLLPNNKQSYDRLGCVINDARLAGLIDWNAITDRTRGVEQVSTWENPQEILEISSRQFRIDKWKTQPYRVEVWIEKEALAGVFERICNELRIPYLSCRGYTSQSEMWRASNRLREHEENGQTPLILHFGDHDPSGLDMSRDIRDRLEIFGVSVEFKRLALNMEQVEEYEPPPNPAKMTDARANRYVDEYGDESWELDALNPTILSNLVRTEVNKIMDEKAWATAGKEEDEHKRLLKEVSNKWDQITRRL